MLGCKHLHNSWIVFLSSVKSSLKGIKHVVKFNESQQISIIVTDNNISLAKNKDSKHEEASFLFVNKNHLAIPRWLHGFEKG